MPLGLHTACPESRGPGRLERELRSIQEEGSSRHPGRPPADELAEIYWVFCSLIRNRRSRVPLDAQDLSEIAAHHSSLGEYDAAIEALEEAMQIAGPRRPEVFTQLSMTRGRRAAADRAKAASP